MFLYGVWSDAAPTFSQSFLASSAEIPSESELESELELELELELADDFVTSTFFLNNFQPPKTSDVSNELSAFILLSFSITQPRSSWRIPQKLLLVYKQVNHFTNSIRSMSKFLLTFKTPYLTNNRPWFLQ